ncbi:MAG TPA: YceI family protein, partial [Chryseosolibacter sp.]
MKTQEFKIAALASTIEWVGRKVTGSHNGTISLKRGSLFFTDGHLSGGSFVIDTRSILILDIADPATNAQFAS